MVKKTLIIGGCGYIGSSLFLHLKKNNYKVDTVDLELFGNFINPRNKKINYKSLSRDFLRNYQNIILLAGHSSVKMSENNMVKTFHNNVVNFVQLLDKIEDQKFIYASSSSVYGGTKNLLVDETIDKYTPSTYYDLSKKEIDYYAHLSSKNYFGLRLGTVCGYSPNLRTDVMINKMYEKALLNKEITIFNKSFYRPILGMNDFTRAISKILTADKDPGIYNLASFNMTIEEIAKIIAGKIKGTKINDTGSDDSYYNFSVSSEKFKKTFKFEFKDNIDTIFNSLKKNYKLAKKSERL